LHLSGMRGSASANAHVALAYEAKATRTICIKT
jgi:hypothetical protein